MLRVTLKAVEYFPSMSEETNAFKANVYVNNKRVGYAKNSGHGGCTDVNSFAEPLQRELFKKAEKFLLKQPQINIGDEADPYMVDCNMESVVDKMFEDWLQNREAKKIQKLTERKLVYEEKGVYYGYGWKQLTIKQVLENPRLRARLKQEVEEYLTEGKKIINTNLPEEWLS